MTENAAGRRVLVVDDDAGWRSIYEDILGDAGYAPSFAVSYGEARGWLERAEIAAAVVDLHLISSVAPEDNRDGFWILRQTRARGIPSIVVSALGAPEDVDRAFEEFAVFAFVEKEAFDRRAFRQTVEEAIKASDTWRVASDTSLDTRQPSPVTDLTEREREVLALMSRGYTNRQIGEELHITANTVKKHVDHILQKLGVSTRAGAVAAALRSGLSEW